MKNTKHLALSAVLLSLALTLSYAERLIPLQLVIPLPGVKLGLANIVTMIALYLFGMKTAGVILVLRCLLASVFGGGITGFLFSLTGGTLALVIMALMKKTGFFSVYGVSIFGAAAHNTGQIFVSAVLMHSSRIFFYLPYLLIVALMTGFVTGSASGGVLGILSHIEKSGPD